MVTDLWQVINCYQNNADLLWMRQKLKWKVIYSVQSVEYVDVCEKAISIER